MGAWPPDIRTTGRKIGYARVSTHDQKLRMQREALNAVKCDLIFEDHALSGALAKRPGLDDMMKELQSGDTVVVFKLDRLGRSVLHLSDLLVRFQQDNIHFCSICEAINTTTPGGKFIYHMFSAFAEFQREIIVENTIHGMQAARKKGKHIGRPYRLDEEAILEGHRYVMQEKLPIHAAASRLKVSHATLTRGFKRMGLNLI
ncbi:MAG: recombinase family protein [Pseudomonadota bacterium]